MKNLIVLLSLIFTMKTTQEKTHNYSKFDNTACLVYQRPLQVTESTPCVAFDLSRVLEGIITSPPSFYRRFLAPLLPTIGAAVSSLVYQKTSAISVGPPPVALVGPASIMVDVGDSMLAPGARYSHEIANRIAVVAKIHNLVSNFKPKCLAVGFTLGTAAGVLGSEVLLHRQGHLLLSSCPKLNSTQYISSLESLTICQKEKDKAEAAYQNTSGVLNNCRSNVDLRNKRIRFLQKEEQKRISENTTASFQKERLKERNYQLKECNSERLVLNSRLTDALQFREKVFTSHTNNHHSENKNNAHVSRIFYLQESCLLGVTSDVTVNYADGYMSIRGIARCRTIGESTLVVLGVAAGFIILQGGMSTYSYVSGYIRSASALRQQVIINEALNLQRQQFLSMPPQFYARPPAQLHGNFPTV